MKGLLCCCYIWQSDSDKVMCAISKVFYTISVILYSVSWCCSVMISYLTLREYIVWYLFTFLSVSEQLGLTMLPPIPPFLVQRKQSRWKHTLALGRRQIETSQWRVVSFHCAVMLYAIVSWYLETVLYFYCVTCHVVWVTGTYHVVGECSVKTA